MNLCPILGVYIFFLLGKESALLFELFCMPFLALSTISPNSSWAACFHTEGLSQTRGWGEHGINLRTGSMNLPLSTVSLQQMRLLLARITS